MAVAVSQEQVVGALGPGSLSDHMTWVQVFQDWLRREDFC